MLSSVDKYVIRKVRERRIECGISQSQLSFELGYASSGFVAMIESGKYDKKYNVKQLNDIAVVLECSPKNFLPDKPFKK